MPQPEWVDALVDENFATTVLGEAVASGELAAFLCDAGLAYVAVNDAACALTGYSSEELLKLSLPDLVVASEEELLHSARRLIAGSVWNGSWRLRRKDGRAVGVTFVGEAARVSGLEGYVLTLCWPPSEDRAHGARRWARDLQE